MNFETAGPLLNVGAFALEVGGAITDKKATKAGNYEVITENVRKFLKVVKKHRSKK